MEVKYTSKNQLWTDLHGCMCVCMHVFLYHYYFIILLPVNRQLNLLSTATPAIGAWLVPIDQLKSSIRKWDMEGTLRVCAVMGCIMTEALEVSATLTILTTTYIVQNYS